ncbi:hypothetical protein [Microbacterium sp. NPDC056569]|uniref:hypothetical protein n=1 Tax=Microbacterium sp. NPDC056569 TaxID=3345867 RepID=UPI00366BD297
MRVLFIDDEEAPERHTISNLLRAEGLDAQFLHPEEVIDDDVHGAELIVVDYFLTHWGERDDIASASRSPRDGLAVIASLRSRLLPGLSGRTVGQRPPRAVAFALWSANLAEATLELPQYTLPSVFARENNLEWVFRRTEVSTQDGARQIASLARAVRAMESPAFDPDWIYRLLDIGQDDWSALARDDVLDCHPPLFDLGPRTGGLAMIRWMLHRVLPYPCFLLDERHLRARLRMDDLSNAPDLFRELAPFEYGGVLSDFGGRRWWRSGVESWLFQKTGGNSGDSIAVAEIGRALGGKADANLLRPVVVLSPTMEPEEALVEVEVAVRVRPDDWPPFADDAFARIEDVRAHAELARIIEPADRYLVGIGSDA